MKRLLPMIGAMLMLAFAQPVIANPPVPDSQHSNHQVGDTWSYQTGGHNHPITVTKTVTDVVNTPLPHPVPPSSHAPTCFTTTTVQEVRVRGDNTKTITEILRSPTTNC